MDLRRPPKSGTGGPRDAKNLINVSKNLINLINVSKLPDEFLHSTVVLRGGSGGGFLVLSGDTVIGYQNPLNLILAIKGPQGP